MISFFAPLMYFLLFNASLIFVTKRSFGKCLPLTMIISAFLLFFSQLFFGTFQVGFIVGILIALLSIIGLIISFRKKTLGDFKDLYFTSGLVAFLVIYIMMFIYDFARGFSVWDEFSHWGVMLKEMVRLDKFYSVEASNLMIHKDYPPIMQLFELFWIKLCGGYSEAYAARALHTFEFSLFIPFIVDEVISRKNIVRNILASLAMILAVMFVMLAFDQHGIFQSIYTDYVMASIVVYLFMVILISQKTTWFETVSIMLGGSFLLLLKQMGLPLYLMAVCFFATIVLKRAKFKIKECMKSVGVRKLILATVALLVPFALWFIWGRVTAGVPKQFDFANMNMGEFFSLIFGSGGEEWQRLTFDKYLVALGQDNISTSFLPMSYIQGVIAFVLLFWGAFRLFRKKLDKKDMIITASILVIGSVGYALVMLLLYVLAFGSREGPALASFERYMGTYLIILFGIILAIVIWQATKDKNIKMIILMAAMLSLICAPASYSKIYPQLKYNNDHAVYEDLAQRIKMVAGDDAKIFIVAQNLVGFHYYLQYHAMPVKFNDTLYSWESNYVEPEVYYDEVLVPEISAYDYLYIADVDDDFNEAFCSVVFDSCPEGGELYKITSSDGKVDLNYIDDLN